MSVSNLFLQGPLRGGPEGCQSRAPPDLCIFFARFKSVLNCMDVFKNITNMPKRKSHVSKMPNLALPPPPCRL